MSVGANCSADYAGLMDSLKPGTAVLGQWQPLETPTTGLPDTSDVTRTSLFHNCLTSVWQSQPGIAATAADLLGLQAVAVPRGFVTEISMEFCRFRRIRAAAGILVHLRLCE